MALPLAQTIQLFYIQRHPDKRLSTNSTIETLSIYEDDLATLVNVIVKRNGLSLASELRAIGLLHPV
jgi:hypothetical protein